MRIFFAVDQFFRDVRNRFAVQGHQISRRLQHLESFVWATKFQVAGCRLHSTVLYNLNSFQVKTTAKRLQSNIFLCQNADPVNGDVGDKAGNEEAPVEIEVVNGSGEPKPASNGAAKKKSLFSKLPKISLGKKPAAKTNDSEENEVAERVTEKKEDAPQEKEEEPAADETKPTEEPPAQVEEEVKQEPEPEAAQDLAEDAQLEAEKQEETDVIKEVPEEETNENGAADDAKGFGKIKKIFTGTIASLRRKTSGKKPKKEEEDAIEEVANEEDEAPQKENAAEDGSKTEQEAAVIEKPENAPTQEETATSEPTEETAEADAVPADEIKEKPAEGE